MSYESIWEDRGLVTRFRDEVTEDVLNHSALEAFADPRFENIEYWISDLSDISGFPASSQSVRRTADLDKMASKRNPDLKVAIIPGPMVVRGMANMYRTFNEIMGTSWKIEIFDTEDAARKWAVAKQ